ncbi:hypothetical protein QJS04_geneDACA023307 [Acorus gramineus]|uniref:Uncharacterized protein n=1 Tax=Acorus gramineus TaxID=55184 RepID=A0AAV9B9G2_ACOGR|nr:hypothetical protein QJS04_geneDACA023307 [Acorus gramineus]
MLTETLLFLFNLLGQAMKKLGEVGQTFLIMALQKLKEALLLLFNLLWYALKKIDQDFSSDQETRSETLRRRIKLGALVVLPLAVGLVFLLRKGKMMKAPGKDCRISRRSFEQNPRRYFRNLRGK